MSLLQSLKMYETNVLASILMATAILCSIVIAVILGLR
jgi:hypothetical protein